MPNQLVKVLLVSSCDRDRVKSRHLFLKRFSPEVFVEAGVSEGST